MVKAFIATVQLVLPYDVTSEAEACDAVSGALSENLMATSGAILDWSYLPMTEGAYGTAMPGAFLSPVEIDNAPETWEADQHDVSFYNPLLRNARRVLDCCTSHVSKETAEWLDRRGTESARDGVELTNWVARFPYGWFIFSKFDSEYEEVPADLLAVQAYARANGFEHVQFDRDAVPIDGLPTFDW
jgi:hypothetical protein